MMRRDACEQRKPSRVPPVGALEAEIARLLGATGRRVEEIAPLHGGFGDSMNFLVSTVAGRFVCKLRADLRMAPHRVFAHASRMMVRRSVPHGRVIVGPTTICEYPALIVEYLEGQSLDLAAASIADNELFGHEFAQWLRRLHSIRSAAFDWERKSRQLFRSRMEVASRTGCLGPQLESELRSMWERLTPSLAGVSCSLVHRDLQETNLLSSEGRFAGVIDFEQCRVVDPLYDQVKLRESVFAGRPALAAAFAQGYGLTDEPRVRDRIAAADVLENLAGIRYFFRRQNPMQLGRVRAHLERLVAGA
jgi:aminoglycoside phosphotransferase (APT) family kinase protein